MEGPSAVLNVMSLPPGATKTQARLVLDGVRGAIFVYKNGGPVGALIGSWAIAAGTDPYTNPYTQGLNVNTGAISGTQLIIRNNFGAIIFEIDPAHDGWFVYADTGSATQGAMIASGSGNSSNDPVTGAPYTAGVNAYVVVGGVTYAIGLNGLGAGGTTPGLSVSDTVNLPNALAGMFAESSNGTTKLARAILSSGAVTVSDIIASVRAQSATDSGQTNGLVQVLAGLIQLGSSGTLSIDDVHGTVIFTHPLSAAPANPGNTAAYVDSNTNLNYLDSGDGNVYHTGHNEASALGQTINTLGYTVLNGSQVNVAAKSYLVEWDLFVTENQAAGIPNYQFSLGGAAVASFAMGWFEYVINGVNTVPAGTLTTPGTISNGFQAPVMASNQVHVKMKLFITFSTGGNVRLAAKTNVAADTFTITGCFTRLEPRQ